MPTTFRLLRGRATKLSVVMAFLGSAPALAQQPDQAEISRMMSSLQEMAKLGSGSGTGDTAQQSNQMDLSRIMSSLQVMAKSDPSSSLIAGGAGELVNTTIAHSGKRWTLIVTGERAARGAAPVTVTLNNDTVKVDSAGTKTIAPVGGPAVTIGLENNSLSFQYRDGNNIRQMRYSLGKDVNLIAITMQPENELVTQAGQLQDQLGRIQAKLRSSPVVAASDSAQIATGFGIHTKLNEVKEILKQISADLDASK